MRLSEKDHEIRSILFVKLLSSIYNNSKPGDLEPRKELTDRLSKIIQNTQSDNELQRERPSVRVFS